jgi:hypothetical protein
MWDLISTFTALNALELAVGLAASSICFWIGWKAFGRINVWGALSIALAMLFDVANVSQFATIDEFGIDANAAMDAPGFLVQWIQGPLHTTGALFVPLGRFLAWCWPGFASPEIALPVFKTLHWAAATILVALVAANASKLTTSRFRLRNYYFLFVMLLLSPQVTAATKTFNYDAFSLLGALLALLLLVRAFLENSRRLGQIAVLVATLATQEKLNAAPVLLACLYCDSVLNAYREQQMPLRVGLITLLRNVTIVLLVAAASTLAYMFATKQVLPPWFFVTSTLDPLTIWAYMPFAFLSDRPDLYARLLVLIAPLTIAAVGIAVVLTLAAVRRFPALTSMIGVFGQSAWRPLPWLMLCAVAGAYLVSPQWAPFSPNPLDALANSHQLNGVFLHFGMRTLTQHYFAYFFYACAVCFVALPSVLWIAAAWSNRYRWDDEKLSASLGILLWVAYVMALLAIVMHVPIGNKYLCISILIIAIVVLVRSLELLPQVPQLAARSHYVLGLAALLMIVEVAPFAPLYASFRPIWIEYRDREPKPGMLNASWLGWGEEAMQAGKLLEARCRSANGMLDGVDCRQLHLHLGYFGAWLGRHDISQDMSIANSQLSSSADYYVFNRSMLVQGAASLWPKIDATLVITARGYPMAWIYRGDKLAASGWFQRDAQPAAH